MSINRQIRIIAMPTDKLGPEHFELAEAPIVKPVEPFVEAFDVLLVRHFVLHLAVKPEPQPVR